MPAYLQYHNCLKNGLLLGDPPFHQTKFRINTSRPEVEQAIGSEIYVIAGLGSPRSYYLWQVFTAEEVHRLHLKGRDEYLAIGPGKQIAPPVRLSGVRFEAFKRSCGNFVGFRRIDRLAYFEELSRLARSQPNAAGNSSLGMFYAELLRQLPRHGSDRQRVLGLLQRSVPMRALSVRQPHAEAIMRGIKPIEYRSGPTRVRGRIWIYSSQVRYSDGEEAAMMKAYRIKDIPCDALPRGVLLGTVDLWKCIGGDWYVQDPQRDKRLFRPSRKPQPKWFYPFGDEQNP